MRPLIVYKNLSFLFTINGRKDFHVGRSEKPVIGTTEDWYIINTMGIDHPIHIHLINFQVISVYDLKRCNNYTGLTYYEMDFVAEALNKTNSTPGDKVD